MAASPTGLPLTLASGAQVLTAGDAARHDDARRLIDAALSAPNPQPV